MVRKDNQKRREGRRIACGRSSKMGGFLRRSEKMRSRAKRKRKFCLGREKGGEEDLVVSKLRGAGWKCRMECGR
jgi:hypothetical protein